MRIRSIKPEFWRSSDISKMAWPERFLFIGLWSYVDDNGVGVDKLSTISADLFADDLETDSSETFARVSRGLQKLSEAGRITRYTVQGKPYLHVTNWEKHQRIDKPNKARYPAPTCDNAQIRETVATPSRESPESPAPGTGEQGNRGTGEQSVVPFRTERHQSENQISQRDIKITAARVINEWRNNLERDIKFPAQTINELTAQITVNIQDGIDPATLTAALERWNQGGYPAKAFYNDVVAVQREHHGQQPGRPQPSRATGTQRAIAALSIDTSSIGGNE